MNAIAMTQVTNFFLRIFQPGHSSCPSAPIHNSTLFLDAGHQVCDLFCPVHGFKSNFNIWSSIKLMFFLILLIFYKENI